MKRDALNNEIVIGQKYGYSITQNGGCQVVTGIACGESETKVTLANVQEASGVYGKPRNFQPYDRKRSVYGCNLFPIYETRELTLAERVKLNGNKNIDDIEEILIGGDPKEIYSIEMALKENKIPKFVIEPKDN
jgi:hypothetical protein